MPRFFFHIRSINRSLSQDKLGLAFPDVETACSEALRAAKGLDDVFVARGKDPRDHAMEVEDASGDVVFSLPFSDIFEGRAEAVTSPSRQDWSWKQYCPSAPPRTLPRPDAGCTQAHREERKCDRRVGIQ